jgi:hypothetical protein
MQRTPSLNSLDKALAAAAGLASKSAKLSPAEKRELRALAAKGAKRGRAGLTMADRARCIWLIRKAGPEKIPDVRLPKRVKPLLGLNGDTPESSAPLRQPDPTVDPLDRLEKLGRLRGKPLSDEQFERQRSRILEDPAIGTFGTGDGVDPLDRLTRVSELEASGILTSDQAADLTERILDAP